MPGDVFQNLVRELKRVATQHVSFIRHSNYLSHTW